MATVTITVSATKVSSTTALIEWSGAGSLNHQRVELRKNGQTVETIFAFDEEYYHSQNIPNSTYYTNLKPDCSYEFKVRGWTTNVYPYSEGTSNWSNTIYGDTPAPLSIIGRAIPSIGTDPNMRFELDNPSDTAVSLKYDIFYGWIWREDYGTSSDIRSFETYIPEDGVRIRVKNVNSLGGESAWLESGELILAKTPSKPIITDTFSIFDKDASVCTLSWLYVNVDNSEQSAFRLQYKFNDAGAWQNTVSQTTASTSYGFSMAQALVAASMSAPCTFTYHVQTKGATDDYSEWSDTRTFTVYSRPTVSITTPSNSSVQDLPISIVASYTDMEGFDCQKATVSLYLGRGTGDSNLALSKQAEVDGNSITAEISGREFSPTNGAIYTVKVEALSSSGLTGAASSFFTLAYTEPKAGAVSIRNIPDEGKARLAVSKNGDGEGELGETVEVKRVNPDGSTVLLYESDSILSAFVDTYAPLNVDYRYAVTTYSSSGAPKTVYFDNKLESSKVFFLFDGDVASAQWQQITQVSYGRPHQETFYFSGRKLPVLIDDEAEETQGTLGFTLREKAEADAFKRMMKHSGSVVYKSTDGEVIHASVSVSISRQINTVSYYLAQLSVKYTQVDGEAV